MKRLILSLLALCLLLTGCGQGSTPAQEADDAEDTHELIVETAPEEVTEQSFGLAYVPEYGLNPYDCTCVTNRPILSLVYECLFVLNSRYEPEPVLCDRFSSTDNGTVYLFRLREGVTFSDGSPLTAEDVVASLKAASGSDYYGNRFRKFRSITAQDELTVQIKLSSPHENLPLLLDVPIVKSGTADYGVPLGTGPYRKVGTHLQRVSHWWQETDPPVTYDTISLVRVETPMEVRDSFEFGDTSLVCADLNAPSAVGYRCDYELWDCPTTVMHYLGFNLTSGVCADPVFRAAITHVIDRDKLVTELYRGFAEPACLPCAPGSAFYSQNQKLAADYGYDPDAFESALRSSSIHSGYGGTILVCSLDTTRVELAHRIAETFERYELKFTVNAVDMDTYRRALKTGNYDIYIGQTRLPGNFDLTEFFRENGALSFGGLASEEITALCASALENSGYYNELYQTVMDRGCICPLLFKSYAVMATRGSIADLQTAVDCVFHMPGGRTLSEAGVAWQTMTGTQDETEEPPAETEAP